MSGDIARNEAAQADWTQSGCGAAETFERPVLSDSERAALDRTAGRSLRYAVMAQGVAGLLAAVLAWCLAGSAAGVSALVGAGAYFLPNSVFALRLLLNAHRPGQGNSLVFFWGEGLKLVATLVILVAFIYWGRTWVVWPALLAGLLCALKGHVPLAILRR